DLTHRPNPDLAEELVLVGDASAGREIGRHGGVRDRGGRRQRLVFEEAALAQHPRQVYRPESFAPCPNVGALPATAPQTGPRAARDRFATAARPLLGPDARPAHAPSSASS